MKIKEFNSIEEYVNSVKGVIAICCECRQRIRVNGNWVLISIDIIKALEVAGKASHTYCSSCFKTRMDQLEEEKTQW